MKKKNNKASNVVISIIIFGLALFFSFIILDVTNRIDIISFRLNTLSEINDRLISLQSNQPVLVADDDGCGYFNFKNEKTLVDVAVRICDINDTLMMSHYTFKLVPVNG